MFRSQLDFDAPIQEVVCRTGARWRPVYDGKGYRQCIRIRLGRCAEQARGALMSGGLLVVVIATMQVSSSRSVCRVLVRDCNNRWLRDGILGNGEKKRESELELQRSLPGH